MPIPDWHPEYIDPRNLARLDGRTVRLTPETIADARRLAAALATDDGPLALGEALRYACEVGMVALARARVLPDADADPLRGQPEAAAELERRILRELERCAGMSLPTLAEALDADPLAILAALERHQNAGHISARERRNGRTVYKRQRAPRR